MDESVDTTGRPRKATPKGLASADELDEVRAKIASLLGIRPI